MSETIKLASVAFRKNVAHDQDMAPTQPATITRTGRRDRQDR
jgi:hypothetical protein